MTDHNRIARLEIELAAAQRQIEADRTAVIESVNALKGVVYSRLPLADGRGSYKWDDDRYQKEFHDAATAILTALEPLQKLGADLTPCPQTGAEVVS